jgi:hypothetical protein
MITLKNSGATDARVFGPSGGVILLEPGETRDVPYTAGDYEVETGGSVVVVEKAAPEKAAPKKPTPKDGE